MSNEGEWAREQTPHGDSSIYLGLYCVLVAPESAFTETPLLQLTRPRYGTRPSPLVPVSWDLCSFPIAFLVSQKTPKVPPKWASWGKDLGQNDRARIRSEEKSCPFLQKSTQIAESELTMKERLVAICTVMWLMADYCLGQVTYTLCQLLVGY